MESNLNYRGLRQTLILPAGQLELEYVVRSEEITTDQGIYLEIKSLEYPFNRTHCKLRRRGLEKFGYVHDRHSQRAARARGEDPAELLPAVHQVVSLAKRWLLGTRQGSVDEAHLASYLNEFVFRFNRRRSRSRGMVFYRVLELAVAHDPVRYQDLIATKRPRAVPSTPPQGRGHPPSLERPPAKRPSRTAGLDGSG